MKDAPIAAPLPYDYCKRNKPSTPDPWVLNGHVDVLPVRQPGVEKSWNLDLRRFYNDGKESTTISRGLTMDQANEIALRCNLHVWMTPAVRSLAHAMHHGNGLSAWNKIDESATAALETAEEGKPEALGVLVVRPDAASPSGYGIVEIGTIVPARGKEPQRFIPVATALPKDFGEEIVRRCNVHPQLVAALARLVPISKGGFSPEAKMAALREADKVVEIADLSSFSNLERRALRVGCTPPQVVPAVQAAKPDLSGPGE